jgi:hypothetical protein
VGVLILGISGIPLGSPETKWHLGVGHMARHKVYYKGEGGGFPPSSGHGESCESVYTYDSSVHQRCFNYALSNLLFGLCRSVWVNKLFINRLSPHLETPTHASTPKMLRAKEHTPTPLPFVVFIFGLAVGSSRSLGVCQMSFEKLRWIAKVNSQFGCN